MIYRWKFQPKGKVPAQVAGEYIERISKENKGIVTAKKVVDEARPMKSPLHVLFEWDDSVAAEKFREQQAQQVICQLVVVQKGSKSNEPLRIRAFVSVDEGENVHYTTLQRAMSKPALRRQIVKQALGELQAWQQKYEDLRELSRIFDAIKEVTDKQKKTMRRKAG